MNTTNQVNEQTNSIIQPTATVLSTDKAKCPFVPPQLIKQGKVSAITQGGGFGSNNIIPPGDN